MADSVHSATLTLPTTTSTLASSMRRFPAIRLWVAWVMACSFGGLASAAFVVGMVNVVLPSSLASSNALIWFGTLALGTGGAAALFAAPQCLVLRDHISSARGWIVTTAVSGIVGVATGYVTFFPVLGILALLETPAAVLLKGLNFPNGVNPDSVLFIAPGAVTGLVVGVAQTRTLTTPDRSRWILGSTAAAAAFVVGAGLGGRLNIVNSMVDSLLVGSVAYGMVSGLAAPGLRGVRGQT